LRATLSLTRHSRSRLIAVLTVPIIALTTSSASLIGRIEKRSGDGDDSDHSDEGMARVEHDAVDPKLKPDSVARESAAVGSEPALADGFSVERDCPS
jgi:hypothetical protein